MIRGRYKFKKRKIIKKIQLGQIEALPELQKLKKQKLNPDQILVVILSTFMSINIRSIHFAIGCFRSRGQCIFSVVHDGC